MGFSAGQEWQVNVEGRDLGTFRVQSVGDERDVIGTFEPLAGYDGPASPILDDLGEATEAFSFAAIDHAEMKLAAMDFCLVREGQVIRLRDQFNALIWQPKIRRMSFRLVEEVRE